MQMSLTHAWWALSVFLKSLKKGFKKGFKKDLKKRKAFFLWIRPKKIR